MYLCTFFVCITLRQFYDTVYIVLCETAFFSLARFAISLLEASLVWWGKCLVFAGICHADNKVVWEFFELGQHSSLHLRFHLCINLKRARILLEEYSLWKKRQRSHLFLCHDSYAPASVGLNNSCQRSNTEQCKTECYLPSLWKGRKEVSKKNIICREKKNLFLLHSRDC